MFKAVLFFALLAFAVAAPEPKPKPGLIAATYTAPSYTPYLASAYAVPTYAAYSAYAAPYAYSAYAAPYAYSARYSYAYGYAAVY